MDVKSLAFNWGILLFAPFFCERPLFQQTLPRATHPTFCQHQAVMVSCAVLRATTQKCPEVSLQ